MSYNSDFQKDSRRKLKKINSELAILEQRVFKTLTTLTGRKRLRASHFGFANKELRRYYALMIKRFSLWANNFIPVRYRQEIRQLNRLIARNKYRGAKFIITQIIKRRAVSEISNLLVSNAISNFALAANSGLRQKLDFVSFSKRAQLDDATLEYILGSELKQRKTLRGLRSVREYLQQQYGTSVIAGRRSYKAADYATLVGRTKFHEAQAQAAKMTALNYDTDLVLVSNHNTDSSICQPYEAKIYSIGGRSRDFPVLQNTPPFHPNCQHTLYPVFREALENRGQVRAYSAFSSGNISRPPVPANFVPISERG